MEKQFTGSTFIVNKDRTKIVLIYHKKYQNWIQPGGRAKEGESPADAAVRKAFEETGLNVKLVNEQPIYVEEYRNFVGHFIDYQYVAEPIDENQQLVPDEGSYAVEWFSFDELNTIPLFPDIKTKLRVIMKR